jgi:hypothetical protein
MMALHLPQLLRMDLCHFRRLTLRTPEEEALLKEPNGFQSPHWRELVGAFVEKDLARVLLGALKRSGIRWTDGNPKFDRDEFHANS